MWAETQQLEGPYRSRMKLLGIPAAAGVFCLACYLGGLLPLPGGGGFFLGLFGGIVGALWAWRRIGNHLLRQQLTDPDFAPGDDGPNVPPPGFFAALVSELAASESPGLGSSVFDLDRGAPQDRADHEGWVALGWSGVSSGGDEHGEPSNLYVIHLVQEITRGGDDEELSLLADRIRGLKADPTAVLGGLRPLDPHRNSMRVIVYAVGGSSARLRPFLVEQEADRVVHLRPGGLVWTAAQGALLSATTEAPKRLTNALEVVSVNTPW